MFLPHVLNEHQTSIKTCTRPIAIYKGDNTDPQS